MITFLQASKMSKNMLVKGVHLHMYVTKIWMIKFTIEIISRKDGEHSGPVTLWNSGSWVGC